MEFANTNSADLLRNNVRGVESLKQNIACIEQYIIVIKSVTEYFVKLHSKAKTDENTHLDRISILNNMLSTYIENRNTKKRILSGIEDSPKNVRNSVSNRLRSITSRLSHRISNATRHIDKINKEIQSLISENELLEKEITKLKGKSEGFTELAKLALIFEIDNNKPQHSSSIHRINQWDEANQEIKELTELKEFNKAKIKKLEKSTGKTKGGKTRKIGYKIIPSRKTTQRNRRYKTNAKAPFHYRRDRTKRRYRHQ